MEFQKFLRSEYLQIPSSPGVYKFLNKEEQIIYVGKAKELKKRVSNYFGKSHELNRKTFKLVSEVAFIEIIVVNSEFDALLLENNLIKENQPKFNILLKDDKSFPSICITNERFPRIYATRRIDRTKGTYYGPYTSVKAMNNVLDLIRRLYTIRTCSLQLSKNNIDNRKFKVCLEYHLKNCQGPCEELQTEENYLGDIDNAKKILNGRLQEVKSHFENHMNEASAVLNFELAQSFKEKLDYLSKFQTKSLIVQPKMTNIDVFTIVREDSTSYVNFMMIHQGTIRISETVEVKNHLDESNEEILLQSILMLKSKYQSLNSEILSNLEFQLDDVEIIVPKIGDKRKLVDLSLRNALVVKQQKAAKTAEKTSFEDIALGELQDNLHLQHKPIHIECFDNSNIQGSNPVASMVCFKNGKPSKRDYRKFNIKTVEGPDDFSSMYEVVFRRYNHLKSENLPLPNLVLIDGGKGQLNAAINALKDLDLYGAIPIIGIAKRLEEIYTPTDDLPLFFNKKSQALILLQRIRDEAHRFAITFHRNKRSKSAITSELDTISGIGPKTKEVLLKHYGSIKKIKDASERDLIHLIGTKKASMLLDAFKKN